MGDHGLLRRVSARAVAAPEVAVLYAEDPDRLARAGRLLPATRGANVVVARAVRRDWFRTHVRSNVDTYVSTAQVALDCLAGNGRMPAEGDALVAWMRKNDIAMARRVAGAATQDTEHVMPAESLESSTWRPGASSSTCLTALEPTSDAVVLVGAQAVYLRTEGRIEGYQPSRPTPTSLSTSRLEPIPPRRSDDSGRIHSLTNRESGRRASTDRLRRGSRLPVDLIVPEEYGSEAGRRAARLPGNHGKTTARKSSARRWVVDNSPIQPQRSSRRMRDGCSSRSPATARSCRKAAQARGRLATPARLQAKDAGDLYGSSTRSAPTTWATLQMLLADERSATTTTKALTYLDALFTAPASPGVGLACEALRTLLPEETVTAVMTAYAAALRSTLDHRLN